MADAAASTGASPAGTAAPAGDAAGQVDPKAPAAWGDADDRDLFERLERSPYRAKIKGEDRKLNSKESMSEILGHAQRGIGASKLVEETKKEREAAASEKAEAAKERELIRRAKAGDFHARRELGLIPQGQKDEAEQAYEQLPPEVRAVIDHNAKMEAELEEYREEKAKAARDVEERTRQTALSQTKERALSGIKEAITELKMPAEQAEQWLDVGVRALADFEKQGLELGTDLTPRMLADRMRQMRGDLDLETLTKLPPKMAMSTYAPTLMMLEDSALVDALPPPLMARIAKLQALAERARKAQAQAGNEQRQDVQPTQSRQADPLAKRSPMSPFRW